MRFCLQAQLPLTIGIGEGRFVVELVDCPPKDGCWLRARDKDDSVTFLLAHFQDRWEAGAALLTGVDINNCPFHQLLVARLLEEGYASLPTRPARPVLLRPRLLTHERARVDVRAPSEAGHTAESRPALPLLTFAQN